jgi:hypothetical protein
MAARIAGTSCSGRYCASRQEAVPIHGKLEKFTIELK